MVYSLGLGCSLLILSVLRSVVVVVCWFGCLGVGLVLGSADPCVGWLTSYSVC